MSKSYVKDTNGKWKLIEKDKQEPKVQAQSKQLTLEDIDARLQKLEELFKEDER